MTLAEQIQIVEDNLKEYGVCDITIEEFNYLKDELYSSGCLAGIELGRTDAFADCILENGEYCWQECCETEKCKECKWLGNGDTIWFEPMQKGAGE